MDMQTLLRFAHKQMVGAAYSTLYVGGLSKKKQSHTTPRLNLHYDTLSIFILLEMKGIKKLEN